MNEADRIRILPMLEAAEEAIQIAQMRSRTSLLAVMKDIEIIGEAANKVSASLRDAEPEIPWRDIVGMRNRLIHAYFDIEPEFVWETVSRDLPIVVLANPEVVDKLGGAFLPAIPLFASVAGAGGGFPGLLSLASGAPA